MIYSVMHIFCWSCMVMLQKPKDLTCNFPIGPCHKFYATKFSTINTSKTGELSGISLGSTIPVSHLCLRWHSFILFLQRYDVIFNLTPWPRIEVSTSLLCFNNSCFSVSWRRVWQPTPVFLPEESHGQRSMVGYNPWGHKEVWLKWLSMHACNA